MVANISASRYHNLHHLDSLSEQYYENTTVFIRNLKMFLNGRLPYKYVQMEIVEQYYWADIWKPCEIIKLL